MGFVDVDGNIERFWWSVCAGVVAVAYNIDHIVCAIRHHLPFIPLAGLYGCKAAHEVTFAIAGGLLWIIGAWALGLVCSTVHRAAKSTDGFTTLRSKK